MLQKRLYYINSRNRLHGTDSDFTISIDMKGIAPDHICVLQANIPKSYYLIQSGENTFQLREGVLTATVTVTPATYGRTTLASIVTTALNNASPNHYTYAITYTNPTTTGDTGKYTFTVTGNAGVQPSFVFTDNNIYEVLGFEASSTNAFTASSLVSTNVIKLQKEDSIFIHSDICTNGNDNVLQEIYASNDSDFSNIVFQTPDTEAYSKRLISNQNNVFRFWLLNEDKEAMNLNGQNWTMTLMAYKTDERLYDFVRSYAKIISKQ